MKFLLLAYGYLLPITTIVVILWGGRYLTLLLRTAVTGLMYVIGKLLQQLKRVVNRNRHLRDMGEVLFIAAGFTIELNRRVKVDNHKLWGSQCLLTDPDAEIDTHREFLRCGSDIMITNTYQASVVGFKKYLGLDEHHGYQLIRNSVNVCKEAIRLEKQSGTIAQDKRILIAGAVGSFGAFLSDGSEYHGNFIKDYTADEIETWHRPRIEALIEGGVDLLAFETIPTVQEARILIKVLGEFPATKAWLVFSGKDGSHTAHGEVFSEVAAECWSLNPTQLMGIGVNCLAANIATELVATVPKHVPIVVYPNCGQIWDAKKKEWTDPPNKESQPSSEDWTRKWCEMGIKYMGLCCGSSMESRCKMRKIIDDFNSEARRKNLIIA